MALKGGGRCCHKHNIIRKEQGRDRDPLQERDLLFGQEGVDGIRHKTIEEFRAEGVALFKTSVGKEETRGPSINLDRVLHTVIHVPDEGQEARSHPSLLEFLNQEPSMYSIIGLREVNEAHENLLPTDFGLVNDCCNSKRVICRASTTFEPRLVFVGESGSFHKGGESHIQDGINGLA